MIKFLDKLESQSFAPLNGKTDPYDLLAGVTDAVGDADQMMHAAGVLGWDPQMIPLSGMDGLGNMYDAGPSNRGIVVPQFPGGPAFFGLAHENFRFIRPEALRPLIDTIAAHGHPLTGIMPGPTTRFIFESGDVKIAPYSDQAKALVGDVIRFRWQLDLGNTGRTSLGIGQQGIRLICANGMTTGLQMGRVSITHDNLAPGKIAAVVDHLLWKGNVGLEKWISDARETIDRKVSLEYALKMWALMFKWDETKTGRAATTQDMQRDALVSLWNAPTQQATFPDTAWAFFNATTEYLDHHSIVRYGTGTREQALARRVLESAPAVEKVKNIAWDLALAA
jgi:hypothetical protein